MPLPDAQGPADLEIGAGGFVAAFRPGAGGRMSRLVHPAIGDVVVPMDTRSFAPFDWPKAGAYPLFPFHNRVIDGVVAFEGCEYRIAPHPALAPDAIHGPAHRRPWTAVEHSADSLSLELAHQADADWPFDFTAQQHFAIAPDRLLVTLRLRNNGQGNMPGGLGWHPYFRAATDQRAETDASLAFPLDGKDLPTASEAIPRPPGALPAATAYTIHLAGWQTARIDMATGWEVEVKALEGVPHLSVHRMKDYICIEPVSHRAGVLGDPENAIRHGFGMLTPGQMIEGRFAIIVQPARREAIAACAGC
ncbi:aldose 1-epimerase [Rhizobium straminoryzae]|uniref:Aldose 1-epimerase n=1 Tax=Rhizobium straminoryzae TaxID=1387186 RepID=A0A549THI0_9HYPH|nr:aldose 1-epimerase [Rhizobium straminoryzae]TRL42482.1 aldose 1-epimerase [Rhizobium straminoryzae]